MYQKIKNVQKVDIFVGYLGTDASYIKLDVKFVFCDSRKPLGTKFFKNRTFLEKRCTCTPVVPHESYRHIRF